MTDPFDEQDRRRPRGRGRRRRTEPRNGSRWDEAPLSADDEAALAAGDDGSTVPGDDDFAGAQGSGRGRGRGRGSDRGVDRGPDRGPGRRPAHGSGRDSEGGPDGDAPADPESVARAICLRALTGAPKTRAQLAELLAKRGVPDDAAAAVLDRFTEVGLIDDAAFARAWVTSRQAGRGLARRALQQELRAKGVEGEDALQALVLVDEDDERETARRLVERRLAGMSRLDRPTATRRLMGMLARKGYGPGLAAGVVRDAVAEAGLPATLDVPPDEDDPDD